MRHEAPGELDALLAAPAGPPREEAWAAFVQRHSRLILHVARSNGGDRDTVMDRYAHILERLNSDNHRRLRTWADDRRSKFTTWLTVVAQRMSLDLHRQRYGRPRENKGDTAESRGVRRRLADLLGDELLEEHTAPVENNGDGASESGIRRFELSQRLLQAVAELSPADQLLLT
jgi:RNA polymerase sigma factor (sigma-70 family)